VARPRIAIGVSSFGEEDPAPVKLLESAGVEIVPNRLRRRLAAPEIIEQLRGADGLIAGLEPLNRDVLQSARDSLRAIARVGIGMSNVDQEAAAELGIRISNTPDAPTEAVAEMTLAALLCLTRNLDSSNRALHDGAWTKTIGRSIAELTVLIIGYGRIGRRVATTLHGLGARILVHDPFLAVGTEPHRQTSFPDGLAEADVISLHASGEKTLLSDREFKLVRQGVILLNSARGELVDEAALIRALDTAKVSQAWFDAFAEEPYRGPLLKYPQVLLTPHSATYTRRCRRLMETEAARNLLRDLQLEPSPTTTEERPHACT
jgi:D-3-phosphoglycerate dehydrogenase